MVRFYLLGDRDCGAWVEFITWGTMIVGGVGLVLGLRRWKRGSSSNGRREVPGLAEFLLCIFARAKDIEALMGDFEEYFERDCASGMSERRAVVRYWARVLRSLWPQIWQWIKRVGWAGLIAAVLEAIGTEFGLPLRARH
jgi:hypothetical protein